jgi:DNA mismatch repair protein MutS2
MGRHRAIVRFGNLKLERELDQLTPAEQPKDARVEEVHWEETGAAPEIKLIGLHVSEALVELDGWLDECVASGLSRVRVIHGKGTWALMRAVTDFLRADPRVDSFRQAPDEEGGAGATIAVLAEAPGPKGRNG